jgi:hypothetical protein
MYGLNQVNRYFERLQPESLPESYAHLEFLIGKTKNNVKYSDLQADQLNSVNQFLMQTRAELTGIGSSFSKYYFGNT